MKPFLIRIWTRLLLLLNKVDYRSEIVSTKPKEDSIPANVIVIVGHKNLPKWALMRCPCGCKELLALSLMKKFSPYWHYEHDNWSRITLSPSVWKKDGCRSHFFIRKGKVIWC